MERLTEFVNKSFESASQSSGVRFLADINDVKPFSALHGKPQPDSHSHRKITEEKELRKLSSSSSSSPAFLSDNNNDNENGDDENVDVCDVKDEDVTVDDVADEDMKTQSDGIDDKIDDALQDRLQRGNEGGEIDLLHPHEIVEGVYFYLSLTAACL